MTDNESAHPLKVYWDRYQGLAAYSESKNNLIEELIYGWRDAEEKLATENARLQQQVEDLTLDLDAATKARRELQQAVQNGQRDVQRFQQDNKDLKNRNPYVIVLIDGDGTIFQEQWIRQGLSGGKQAANALRQAIIDECHDELGEDFEVVAKVAANVSALGNVLAREGSIDDMNDFKEFTLGFTQAKAAFDFIDVGWGKEQADQKVREMTRWNLRNHNCKKVFLGISHDDGYAPFLDNLLQDAATRSRVAIIEGVPTTRGLRATELDIIRDLPGDLFRSDKIVNDATHSNGVFRYTSEVSNGAVQSPASARSAAKTDSPPPSQTSGSWVKITQEPRGASPPPVITLPLGKLKTKTPPPVQPEVPEWNPGPRGLDPVVTFKQKVLDTVKIRKGSEKYCNNFFLRGTCSRRDICEFNHEASPTQDELDAITFLTRQNPCGDGQNCYVENCIYGHHCPFLKDGQCLHPFCKFPRDAHPPGCKIANKRIDYN